MRRKPSRRPIRQYVNPARHFKNSSPLNCTNSWGKATKMCSLLIGIVSSIIGGGVLKAYQLWFLPKITQCLHSVPRLNGTRWKYCGGLLEIYQWGNRISAKATRPNSARIFQYQGKITSGQLILTWEEPDGAGYIVGAMVLKLSQDQKTLKGKTVYLNQNKGAVVSHDRLYDKAR